jgi:hypothetical protein
VGHCRRVFPQVLSAPSHSPKELPDMVLRGLSQAAAKLHCSERWLADNLRADRFPAKKIGANGCCLMKTLPPFSRSAR